MKEEVGPKRRLTSVQQFPVRWVLFSTDGGSILNRRWHSFLISLNISAKSYIHNGGHERRDDRSALINAFVGLCVLWEEFDPL